MAHLCQLDRDAWPGTWGGPSPSLNLGLPTLCLLSPWPFPQGGGYSLAVIGQLQVIGPHFEEVQEVWAAGDLHGQSHEAVEVLGEGSLAALSCTLPIIPPGSCVGAPESREHTHTKSSPDVCGKGFWRAEAGAPRGLGTLLRGSGYILSPGRCGMTLFSVWISPASMGNISFNIF